jgi:cell division topological specificity factor MinE
MRVAPAAMQSGAGVVSSVQPLRIQGRSLPLGARGSRASVVASNSYRSTLTGTSDAMPEDADFLTKVRAAWRIFFPERASLSPKEEGKKRLRMILVADRCGMSSDSLVGMRESIVKAMTQYVEVEQSEAVEVNMDMDPEMGTIYSVAVPVKRVKPTFRPGRQEEGFDPDDPADQFPWGT